MFKNMIKKVAGCCFAALILLGMAGTSSEAAELSLQETNVLSAQEWETYVDDSEEYKIDSIQTMENGNILVSYRKEESSDASVLSYSADKHVEMLYNVYNSNGILVLIVYENSAWTTGGSVGDLVYFGAATYSTRYMNFDYIDDWSITRSGVDMYSGYSERYIYFGLKYKGAILEEVGPFGFRLTAVQF